MNTKHWNAFVTITMDRENTSRIMREYFAHYSVQWQWELVGDKLSEYIN